MSITIGRAVRTRVPQLMELDERIFGEADLFTETQWDRFAAYWIYKDGVIIGSFAFCLNRGIWGIDDEYPPFEAGSLYIATTGLLPEYRGQGIGKKVKLWQVDFAKSQDFKRIVTNCRESNVAIRELNGDIGFVPIDQIPHYYRSPDEDAIVMELKL